MIKLTMAAAACFVVIKQELLTSLTTSGCSSGMAVAYTLKTLTILEIADQHITVLFMAKN